MQVELQLALNAGGGLDVGYASSEDVYGFQFVVTGVNVTGVSGGAAADAGFSQSTGNNTVLGFSFSGTFIPAGSGVLTVLNIEGSGDACLADVVISGENGTSLTNDGGDCVTIEGCDDVDADGICDDVDDCVGAYDECGICNGDGIADGACDCDGNVEDCAGECGGSAVEDECGVCGGDGSSCPGETSFVDVLYNSDADIYGFQFLVNGVDVVAAGGGDAEAAGFTTSTGNNTVLGFSFSGTFIAAGSGVLTTLEVEGLSLIHI